MATSADYTYRWYQPFNPGYSPPKNSPTTSVSQQTRYSQEETNQLHDNSFLVMSCEHSAAARPSESEGTLIDNLLIKYRDYESAPNTAVPSEETAEPGHCINASIKRQQLKTSLRKTWKRSMKSRELKLTAELLPNFTYENHQRALHLAVSLKVRKNLPEYKYEANTRITLTSGNLSRTKQEVSSFEDGKAEVGFISELAFQEEIEKNDSSGLKLYIAVQLNKSFKEDFVIVDMPEDMCT